MDKIKIALCIEYNGKNFYGWQKQKKFRNTVQENVESVLSIIAKHTVKIFGSGRTDSGVHSIGQIAHFYTNSKRNISDWVKGSNFYLPKDISIKWAMQVPFYFHAKNSALFRHYKYVIYNKKYRTSIFKNLSLHVNNILDIDLMNFSGKFLIGENNFFSFKSKGCQSLSNYRNVIYFNVYRLGSLVIIDIIANSFLYNMVRNIVGCLIDIGKYKKDKFYIKNLLKIKIKKMSFKASSSGLYLFHVYYPPIFNFPKFDNNFNVFF